MELVEDALVHAVERAAEIPTVKSSSSNEKGISEGEEGEEQPKSRSITYAALTRTQGSRAYAPSHMAGTPPTTSPGSTTPSSTCIAISTDALLKIVHSVSSTPAKIHRYALPQVYAPVSAFTKAVVNHTYRTPSHATNHCPRLANLNSVLFDL